ncbi:MAG: sugar ABC transporter substrate-binding protein [Trueperaceae bacterium]|nr:sugar ABC transporter substrate-binding protein [Trueperaceae bacterium]
MRRLRALLVTVLAILATGALAQTTITWSFWGDPGELPPNDAVIAAFEAAHPDIKIEKEHAPWSSYFDKLQTEMAGGAAPDVMFLTNVPSYAARGVLEPLDGLIAADGFPVQNYAPGSLAVFSYDGATYGFPRDNDTTVLYYNKDLFDAAGLAYPDDTWRWDDLRSAALALTKQDDRGRTVQYGLALEKNKYPTWVSQGGGSLFDDPLAPTTFTMDSPEAIAAIQFVADLILKDKSVPSFDAMNELGSTTELFSTGRVAMVMTNAARIPTFEQASFAWNVAPLPAGPTGVRANSLGGAGYVMSSASDNKEAAWTFLKFVSGPEGQAIFAESGLAVPAYLSPETGAAFASAGPEGVDRNVFMTETANGVLGPQFPAWREIEQTIVTPGLDLVWNGEQTAAQALAAMAPLVNAKLAEAAGN